MNAEYGGNRVNRRGDADGDGNQGESFPPLLDGQRTNRHDERTVDLGD